MFYKRALPLIICFVVGVLAFCQEFVAHPWANVFREEITTWFRIMGGFAVFIGAYSLLHMHVTRIRLRQQGWGYSAFVFLGAAATIVAGSLLTSAIYKRAAEIGIAALICDGIHDSDLRELLGYDPGVAITGHEKIKPIPIVTEGFGPMTIAKATHQLLESRASQAASANGATQIGVGVLRPEIIIPSSLAAARGEGKAEPAVLGLRPESPVRIIREPGFGCLGAIKSLPEGLVRIETEAKVRVAEVEFQDGNLAGVPCANVEAIES